MRSHHSHIGVHRVALHLAILVQRLMVNDLRSESQYAGAA